MNESPFTPLAAPTVQPFAPSTGDPAAVSAGGGLELFGFIRPAPTLLLPFRDVGWDLLLGASGQEPVVVVALVGNQLLDRSLAARLEQVPLHRRLSPEASGG